MNTNTYIAFDYYPFGMPMPGRHKPAQSGDEYRFGFNGMENADDIANGNYTTPFREIDTRLGGRWWSKDPIVKPWESPYAGFANNPILFSDPSGLDITTDENGCTEYSGEVWSKDGGKQQVEGMSNEQLVDLGYFPTVNEGGNTQKEKQTTGGSSESFQLNVTRSGPGNRHINVEGFLGKHNAFVNMDWFGTDVTYTQGGLSANFGIPNIGNTNTGVQGSLLLNVDGSIVGNQVDAGIRLGHENLLNVHAQGSGRHLVLEAGVNTGIATGEKGQYGLMLGGQAGAYVVDGQVEFGGTVLGVTVNGVVGGSLASAHAGLNFNAYWDNTSGSIVIEGAEHLGFGVGEKLGVNVNVGVRGWYENTVGYIIDLLK